MPPILQNSELKLEENVASYTCNDGYHFNSGVKEFKYNCTSEGWDNENVPVCIKGKSNR